MTRTSKTRCARCTWTISASTGPTCTTSPPHEEDPGALPLPGPRCGSSPASLGLQDRLDLQVNGDLVGDDHAAGLHRGVPVDAEVLPVDLGRRREAGPRAAVGVRAEPVDLELERDATGHAL